MSARDELGARFRRLAMLRRATGAELASDAFKAYLEARHPGESP